MECSEAYGLFGFGPFDVFYAGGSDLIHFVLWFGLENEEIQIYNLLLFCKKNFCFFEMHAYLVSI